MERAPSSIGQLKSKLLGSTPLHTAVIFAAGIALQLLSRGISERQCQQHEGHPGKDCHVPDNLRGIPCRKAKSEGHVGSEAREMIAGAEKDRVCYAAPDFPIQKPLC